MKKLLTAKENDWGAYDFDLCYPYCISVISLVLFHLEPKKRNFSAPFFFIPRDPNAVLFYFATH